MTQLPHPETSYPSTVAVGIPRILRRVAAIAMFLLLGVAFGVEPSGAQTVDYGGGCSVAVVGMASPGGTITVQGSGHVPGTSTPIFLNGVQVGTAVADANGNFSVTITLPSNLPTGDLMITTHCDNSATPPTAQTRVLRSQLTNTPVNPPRNTPVGNTPARPSAPLVKTGTESASLAALGFAGIAIGTVFVLLGRRRRSSAA